MKVILFIDCLNAGGAQRQLILLAKLLVEKKINIEFLTYNKDDFFLNYLNELNIKTHSFHNYNKVRKFFKIRKFLRQGDHDIVVSYLTTPNLISELSNFPSKKWKLIISERNQNYSKYYWRGLFHIFSDYIIVNSISSYEEIIKKIGINKTKCHVIHNGVDSSFFVKNKNTYLNRKIIVISKYSEQKNIFQFIKAVSYSKKIFRKFNYKIDWYGDLVKNKNGVYEIYEKAKSLINKYEIEDILYLHKRNDKVSDLYKSTDALILPSKYEGLPNVVLEAMASKLPILMSKVSDYKLLVKNDYNGYIFNSNNYKDISLTMEKFINLSVDNKIIMGKRSYQIVTDNFSENKYIQKYIDLFNYSIK
jgi:glycosyltransferase involved in cell wall biosynthesis